jgi:hypothetical protein
MPKQSARVFLGDSMNITFDKTIEGFTFTGMAEVEPSEPATDIDPAWPAIVTVYALHLEGSHKDCLEIIDPAIVQRIEQMILEAL